MIGGVIKIDVEDRSLYHDIAQPSGLLGKILLEAGLWSVLMEAFDSRARCI